MTSNLTYTTQADGKIAVAGNTYPVRETIKKAGGRWDAMRQVWVLGPRQVKTLQAAIEALPEPAAKVARPVVRAATAAVYVRPAERAGGRCRARGCGSLAVVGGYCRSCAHDEV